ncbi:T9SS type A sorting domain-containing protein [Aureispira anguillae]|uniref:T9SS type A sorting domain-containing protein n=1 Tax=Aureispira anguillae TaxID=2864201 RepID=A0A916DVD0_9BACT|nr:T9SS type A sorting domain-containing protein [Aureispira anguillae]BDS14241.1 T9SS type A sorting domain-containing protein [Aureispira anguillae]
MQKINLLVTLFLLSTVAAFAQVGNGSSPNSLVFPAKLNQELTKTDGTTPASRYFNKNIFQSSTGVLTPSIFAALDAGISAIINPVDSTTICDDPFAPEVVVENFGTTTLTSVMINYQVNGGATSSIPWVGSLATGERDTVTFLQLVNIPAGGGVFTFTVSTSSPNGGVDGDPSNDATTVVSQYRATLALPYAENFGGGAVPSNIIVSDQNGDGIVWTHNSTVNGYGATTNMGCLRMDNYSTNFTGGMDWCFLPSLDLTGQASASLTFDVAYARYGASNSDTLLVVVNSDCGSTYNILYRKGGTDLATAADATAQFVPTAGQWRTDTIDLSAYAGASHVRVAFINLSGYGQHMYIDNINVQATAGVADAGISAITNPVDSTTICDDPFAPEVVIENFGTATLTTATINYQVNGGAVSTFSWTGSLAAGATDTVTLPLVAIPAGGAVFTFNAYTSNPNGGADANASNDATSVISQYRTTMGLPYAEDFSGGAVPTNLTILDQNGDGVMWAHNSTVNGYGAGTGTGSIQMNNYATNFTGALDWFILPSFDLTGQANASLTFDVAYARYGASNSDTLLVAVNSDCGTTYSVLYRKGGTDLATAADATAQFVPTAGQWRTDTIDLSAYAGASHVRVAFINLSGYGQHMYIDNINVQAAAGVVDAGISAITNPVDSTTICDDPFAPEVVIENFGTATLTTATINYQVNGGAVSTFSWTGSLAAGATDTVTLPLVAIPAGGAVFTFNAYTSNPNGGADANASNDATSVISQYRTTMGLPYAEDFSGGAVPTNLTILDQNGDGVMWAHNSTVNGYGAGTGTGSIQMDNYATNFTGALDWFILPSFDLTGQTNASLTFDVAYARYGASNSDTLLVAVNSDCGTTYSVLYRKGGTDLATAADATAQFVPTAGQWRTDTIDLSAYAGASHVRVAFINLSGYGQHMYIDNINVQVPCNLTADLTASSDVSCNGGNDGTATVVAAGGTPSYSYDIGTGSQATGVFTNLSAGTYIVTVTDNGICSDTVSVVIGEPSSLSASLSASTNVNCFGDSTGTATIAVSGGTPGYTYNLGAGVQLSNVFTGLAGGSYTVTVTDTNSCTAIVPFVITAPASAVDGTISSFVSPSCNGNSDGSAVAIATGGTGAHSFVWSNGSSLATATGLGAGTYEVTVTDANGCTDTAVVTINEPAAVVATATVNNNVSCNGNNDGSATATATGGTGAYSFVWSNGSSVATATGLGAGTYTVTVSDANGCNDTSMVIISEPMTVVATATVNNNASCNGNNDGSATATATGGTGAYSFVWSNGSSVATATGLGAGTYTVTVSDANGCNDTSMVTISEPTAVAATATVNNNASCNDNNDGSATATATGGTGAYSFVWSNGLSVATATGLGAGTYTVTVSDANGCSDTSMVTISEPTAVVATTTLNSNVSCNGNNDGSATATAAGGAGAHSFVWSNGSSVATATGLGAGTYTVTVSDANGCSDTSMITIVEPIALAVNITDNGDGTATATTTGGVASYSYQWDAAAGNQTTAIATGLVHNGTYGVTVTDANGCTSTASVVINIVGVQDLSTLAEFKVLPNPNTGLFQIQVSFEEAKETKVSLTNVLGQVLQAYNYSDASFTIPVDIQEEAAGVYFVVLEMDNQRIVKKVVVSN